MDMHGDCRFPMHSHSALTPPPSPCITTQHQQSGYDVVLVDTAGRMQNKEPLMRALAKLVSDNEPHLVLFVGEALVGNDGIDQLSTFNQALANYSPPGALFCSLSWLSNPPPRPSPSSPWSHIDRTRALTHTHAAGPHRQDPPDRRHHTHQV